MLYFYLFSKFQQVVNYNFSYTAILPISQVQAQQLLTSQIRSCIKYSVPTMRILPNILVLLLRQIWRKTVSAIDRLSRCNDRWRWLTFFFGPPWWWGCVIHYGDGRTVATHLAFRLVLVIRQQRAATGIKRHVIVSRLSSVGRSQCRFVLMMHRCGLRLSGWVTAAAHDTTSPIIIIHTSQRVFFTL